MQHNQNVRGETKVRPILYHEMPKVAKSYLTTYVNEISTKLQSLF